MTFMHQLGIIIGFGILFLAAAPYLAAGAVSLAQWIVQ